MQRNLVSLDLVRILMLFLVFLFGFGFAFELLHAFVPSFFAVEEEEWIGQCQDTGVDWVQCLEFLLVYSLDYDVSFFGVFLKVVEVVYGCHFVNLGSIVLPLVGNVGFFELHDIGGVRILLVEILQLLELLYEGIALPQKCL